MSDIRLEALRLAVTLNSDADKVVETAEKFVAFLGTDTQKIAATSAKVEIAKTPTEPAKDPVTETSTKVEEIDINTRVQALAKALLKKDRQKLVAVLADLGFAKASVITADKLPAAEAAFTKALA